MNQFMIGLVHIHNNIIILVILLGVLNKMYPENFFGTCQTTSSASSLGSSCSASGNTCPSPPYNNIYPPAGCYEDGTGCASCNYD